MDKQTKPNYFLEWFNAVPARWYGMTLILIALVAVIVGGIIWLSEKGLDWWWLLSGTIIVFAFTFFSFLAYRKVAIERDEARSEISRHKNITEQKLVENKTGVRPKTFSLTMVDIPRTHKCSQCGFGVIINKLDTVVICPKCGNTDNVGPLL